MDGIGHPATNGTIEPSVVRGSKGMAMISKFGLTSSVVALSLAAGLGFASAETMDELVAAAKKEGQLTVIALPRDWCGYGPIIDSFKAKYGISVNELNPDAGSGDEIEAIK